MIWNAIRFIIISLLSIVYWPINILFLMLKKHYFIWKKDDRISYYLATPLYWICFLITACLSAPLEILGESAHPPLDGFK